MLKRSPGTILLLFSLASLVACANLVPREGWNEHLGPVVPHDTFPSDCSLCHLGGSWNRIKPDFEYDHEAETGVALNGAHRDAQCLLCHNDRGPVAEFSDRGCRGCHEDVHRGRLGSLCQDCHNESSWRPEQAITQHARTRFPLVGAHAAADCISCHPAALADNFEVPSIDCESCHASDITRSTSLDHLALGLTTSCERCHSPVGWTPAAFDHPATFPLVGGHAPPSCSECHTSPGTFAGLSTECQACHLDDFQATDDPNHVAAGFGTDCAQCHTVNRWEGALFTHVASFPLTAGHANRSCNECHTTPGSFAGLSTDCAFCHLDDFQATTDPNHVTGGFDTNCTLCHTTSRWEGADFEHTATFPLSAGHANRSCNECHTTPGVYTGLTTDCQACHLDDYQATTDPNHVAGGFDLNCTLCHTTSQWQGADFEHAATFPLSGGHANRSCTDCHTTPGVYTGLSTDCASCHLDDYQGVTYPNHVTGGFDLTCTRCHNTVRWQGASFQHTPTFPLTQGHANSACTDCHTTPGVYTGLSTDCVSCHLGDYQGTDDPAHAAAGISTNCTQCHTTSRWEGASFDHVATFPLSAGHASRDCSDCHTTPGTYAGLSTDCAFCHLDDYQRTTDPNHVAGGFDTNCTLCHNTTQWQDADFQHPATFPLTQGHANRSCTECHTTPGTYAGLSTDCASCHLGDFQATTDPNHVAAGISTNCTQCHTTSRWEGAVFDHVASFPLTQGHANRACTECHTVPGVYTGLSTDCAFCHLDDYQGTTDPNHVATGFSTNCTQCHTTTRWEGAVFNHPASFPLTQGHANQTCNACHTVPGVYTGLTTDCVFCHLPDYQGTTDPNHVAAGFDTNCVLCHNTSQWPGATFVHPPTFPLTQGHANQACTECHTTPGTYAGLSTDCVACHLADYQGTTDPNHAAAGFDTNCTLCHGTSQWAGATFVHPPTFPLTQAHANRSCTECHTTPGTYAGLSTDCVSCHLADYQGTTNPNHATLGYPMTCVDCHTPTNWDDATFNHPRINRGDHRNLDCIDCHTVPATTPAFSCTHCHEHRRSSTDNDHSDVPGYEYLSSACYGCHD